MERVPERRYNARFVDFFTKLITFSNIQIKTTHSVYVVQDYQFVNNRVWWCWQGSVHLTMVVAVVVVFLWGYINGGETMRGAVENSSRPRALITTTRYRIISSVAGREKNEDCIFLTITEFNESHRRRRTFGGRRICEIFTFSRSR